MGILSKIFKPIKKVVKKVGKFIKRVAKKVGGAFGKLGILGHIGMMFLMPYASSFWGSLGKFGTQLVQGTSLAGKGFGHLMRGIYHAGKAVSTVYRGVTEAISGTLKWMGNKAGSVFGKPELFGKPWEGLKEWGKKAQSWGSEGWAGKISESPITDMRQIYDDTLYDDKGVATNTKDSIYDIGDPANYDPDIATGKKQIDPQITDTTTVDVDFDDSSLLSKGKEILKEGFEKSKTKFVDTIVDAPSMLVRDVLKTGVQKSIMGTPQVSYGGKLSFQKVDSGDVLSMNDIDYDPNKLYSQGYNVGSPFFEPFSNNSFFGEDNTWEMWASGGTGNKTQNSYFGDTTSYIR